MEFELARRMKQLRMKSRFKDYENISKSTGLSKVYLHNLENGINKNPGLDVIVKLSEYYGLELNRFFTMDAYIRTTVCMDVDGVILDWNGALEKYLATKGINFDKSKMTIYSYTGNIGCTKKEIYKAIEDIEFLDILYKNPYEGALEALNKLCKSHSVYINAYTASSDKEDFYMRRVNFCEELGMDGMVYPSHNHTGVKPVLPNIHALFEDNLTVIRKWLEEEPNTIIYMIDQPYNRPSEFVRVPDSPQLKRCTSLVEAVDMFLKDFGFIN